MTEEKKIAYELNDLVHTYNIDNIYDQYKRYEFLEKLSPYLDLTNSKILEFGPASGQFTAILAKHSKEVVAVDGAGDFIEIAKQQVRGAQNVRFYESYFERFDLDERFDCLIMHHILEHIEQPASLLAHIRRFMDDTSILAISVPNAQALSRRLAVKMGLLGSVYDLTENDRHHGHYRVYDWKSLESDVVQCGFRVVGKHGLSFKLLSDKQNVAMIEAGIIGEQQIRGLWQIGDELAEHCGAIMMVLKT